MTSVTSGTCSDCGRPRRPGAIFCECGALLDYTASGDGNGHKNGKPATADSANQATKSEWPPEPPYRPSDESAAVSSPPLRVIYCPRERCRAVNPERLILCWSCHLPLRKGDEVSEPWSWRRVLRLERPPLRAGQRKRPRLPFLSKDPRAIARSSAIVLGVLVVGAALVIGAIKGWQYGARHGPHWFSAARERVFPRFRPHHPSSLFPTRYEAVKPGESLKGAETIKVRKTVRGRKVTQTLIVVPHPAVDAFDRNLSTYWQSTTSRRIWDRVRVTFNPPVKEFNDVAVFAGDPTAKTIVPRELQMTFYTWEPHRPTSECTVPPVEPKNPRRKGGTLCVTGKPVVFKLLNTPAEQRFSFGRRRDIGLIVITIRGTHHSDNPKAKAAITDIEFFDRF